jgi:glycosyltransferase involved in cell wall biosynthesis
MRTVLLIIGIFGFLGLSVLCPILAFPIYCFQRARSKDLYSKQLSNPLPFSIEIIIPAHNEAEQIGATIAAINRAAKNVSFKVSIRVGVDGCTDQTAQIARQYLNVIVTEFTEKKGKWAVLQTLVATTMADWVFLVDVGCLWPEIFLSDMARCIEAEPRAVGLAPSYHPLKSGFLTRLNWQLETCLKRLETLCGGPISVHGATVGYKTTALKNVFLHLKDGPWLNDDVAIPLMLRALYPECLIVYPAGQVHDAGGKHHQLDLGRRERMLRGNLQWIVTLFPACFGLNPVAGMVALRRIFRLFWAYWFVLVGMGLSLAFHSLILPGVIAVAILLIISGNLRQMAGAAWVSLLAPCHIVRFNTLMETSWK